jgi:protein-tyrosine kinase
VTPGGSNTLIAEEFRLVKRQLLANVAARGPGAMKDANLILVGSAMPAEGKTFCAINLALSIAAERDLTVLLVDADVSKPEIVTRLGLEGGPGLTDVVADRALDVGDCLIRTNVPNLTVLPAGRPHGLTTELFASERMEDIMEEIARRYTDRVVIFDSPPALVNSAASVLATRVGQVVFVVAAEMTKESELKEGLALMSGCPNVQLLLNRSRFFPAGRRFAATDYYPA